MFVATNALRKLKLTVFSSQPIEETSSLIDVSEEFVNSKACQKGDPSQFELLKVLGQGSFGKVIFSCSLCSLVGF